MLSKKQRLTKRQFDHHFKVGKRQHSANLQLIVSPAETFSGAVVVGKKVFKQAVKRNQLRRRLYGVLYRWQQQSPRTGVYIILAKPTARSATRRALLDETQSLLARVR